MSRRGMVSRKPQVDGMDSDGLVCGWIPSVQPQVEQAERRPSAFIWVHRRFDHSTLLRFFSCLSRTPNIA